ncbi:transcriptional regulator [Aetokthonos hydrillicola Thurmond2011]|uniref:Transcriptional regulator n=1 Tax=Aetokthonos hydrillicola Thurmond2011 TaxID=2712845 RepID=A0AAP5ME96_9CYAN|nr:transcriptional regulator [Aetokthonos hydrillicola]MBO3464245.1 transcriptional regulator [Aetokthonos hydrillicola CCALA 1050]MBW4590024.1 transcriptional regulator [Aetokthonos hydrillicola CCALA 1050]MDR9900604.1 transcriptional regulator [Aetokthonos hydrillicola Thurmond2011]
MTTDSLFDNRSRLQFYLDLLYGKDKHTNESTGAMDMVRRDRFELLSAYLDGEVTAAERKQVEQWLAEDQEVQRLYTRLLKLRQGLRTLQAPPSKQSVEETVKQVLARSHRRSKVVWLCGGATIAACAISAISVLFPNAKLTEPQLAHQSLIQPAQQGKLAPQPPPVVASPLMIAINNSVVPIPKAAEAFPQNKENKLNQEQSLPQNVEKEIN